MRDFFTIRFDMEAVDHDPIEAAMLESAIETGLRKIHYTRSGSACDGTVTKLVFRKMSRLEEMDDCRRIK